MEVTGAWTLDRSTETVRRRWCDGVPGDARLCNRILQGFLTSGLAVQWAQGYVSAIGEPRGQCEYGKAGPKGTGGIS